MNDTDNTLIDTILGDTDEDVPPVHLAWSRAMNDVREIRKGERNKQQGFSFRGVDTVVNTVGPVFRKYGIIVLPGRIVETKHRDFTSKNGALMHEAIVTVEWKIIGPAGDMMTGQSTGESSDSSDKATTQAQSVAWRVFLLEALCVPTDDPDPDHHTVDRASVGEPRPEFTDEERAAAWVDLVTKLNQIVPEHRKPIQDWMEAEGIDSTSLTRAQARDWFGRMDGQPTRPVDPEPPAPEPETASESIPTADEVAAAQAVVQDAFPGAEEPQWESDDQRAAAWADLHDRHGRLIDTGKFDAIQSWIEAEGIGPETLTRNQARSWFERMNGEALRPETPPKGGEGYKTKAEQKRTYDSLLERTNAANEKLSPSNRDQHGVTAPCLKATDLTPLMAETWLAEITRVEQEAPF